MSQNEKIQNIDCQNVSGGGKRWSSDEIESLFSIAPKFYSNSKTLNGYNWNAIANTLNATYKNNRTPNACAQQFYRRYGDGYGFIDKR